MTKDPLFLFLLVLLGIALCSFLVNIRRENFTGSNSDSDSDTLRFVDIISGAATGSVATYDNYNHYNGESTKLLPGSTYYGPDKSTAVVQTNRDGSQQLILLFPSTNKSIALEKQPDGTFAQENMVAVVKNNQEIHISTPFNTYIYTSTAGTSNTSSTSSNTSSTSPASTVSTTPLTSTQYYGATGSQIEPTNEAYQSESSITSNTLPSGIPRDKIPDGQEDLYILKTEIVPTTCTINTTTNNNTNPMNNNNTTSNTNTSSTTNTNNTNNTNSYSYMNYNDPYNNVMNYNNYNNNNNNMNYNNTTNPTEDLPMPKSVLPMYYPQLGM